MSDSRPTPTSSPNLADDPAVAAIGWIGRHDRGLTRSEARAFAAWRAASPRNAAEFDRLAGAWQAADLAKSDPGLVALAAELETKTREAPRRSLSRSWLGGLAAATAAVAMIAWVVGSREPARVAVGVEVVPSAARRMALSDGSVADVRSGGEVRAAFTPGERRVQLVRGEAHFTVQTDTTRPFIVEARGLAVRAVGTAFNVRIDAGSIEVTVTEGSICLLAPAQSAVSVEQAPRVEAGQRAVVTLGVADRIEVARAAIESVSPGVVERTLAWQGTRLVLNRATFEEAIAAFNRHGGGRLELGDDSIRQRQLSGTFRADNAEAFVRLMELGAEVRIERRPDGVVVLRSAQ